MVLNCSHHYCDECGHHRGGTAPQSHRKDCPQLERDLEYEKWILELAETVRERRRRDLEAESETLRQRLLVIEEMLER